MLLLHFKSALYNYASPQTDRLFCELQSNVTVTMLLTYTEYKVPICLVIGLSQLLHECEKFGTSHDLKYNAKKSAVNVMIYTLWKGVLFPTLN